MPRMKFTMRWIGTISVTLVVAIFVVQILNVRRQHFLQKAAFFEHRAKVGEQLTVHHPQEGWRDLEKRYRERCAEAARLFRHTANFPLLPEPPEPRMWDNIDPKPDQ